jgi:FkbM family methyltransferase
MSVQMRDTIADLRRRWPSIRPGDTLEGDYPRVCAHTFLRRGLPKGGIVVDLGGNNGGFAHVFGRIFGCKVIVAEPNPAMFQQIEPAANIFKTQVAISGSIGWASLQIGSDVEASTIVGSSLTADKPGTVRVETVTLTALLERYDISQVDFLKVDIEGMEIEMFDSVDDALLSRISQINVEFHEFNGLVKASEIERTKTRMKNIGFSVIDFSTDNYDVLFINQTMAPTSDVELAYLRYFLKPARGLMRRVQGAVAANLQPRSGSA